MEKDKRSQTVQKSYFDVLGICCSSEVPLIENILKSLDGVKEVSVVVTTRTVIVLHDNLRVSQLQIVKALNEARLEANIRVEGENNFKKKWPSPYAMACGVLVLLSFLKYTYKPLGWLALGAVAIGVIPICLKAIASLRNLRLDINILAIIAVIGTIALGDYVEAGAIVFLFTIAEWLESRASYKANAAMTSLMSMVPQKAVIAETGEVVAAEEVKLNTVLAVKAGEVIPIDGVVVEGNCEVDEKTLTGESFPVTKQKDSIVWAGTINLNGYITVKTTSLAEDCAVAKMATLVEEAQNSTSKTQRLIDQCAKFYTPVVIIISILVAVIPVALRLGNLKKWLRLALVIMVSACPCALILSTPVATFCALTKAAKSGLLVKRSDYLEILSKIKILAFDKTGTITKGEFTVTDFETTRDDISSEDLLYWVSSIESKSSHPMAAALVEYGKSHSIEPKPENVEDFQNFPGEGIFGRIEGKNVYIGNKKISARASCETAPTLEGNIKNGKSVGYIYCGGLVGTFSLADTCRFGVEEAIKELKSLGIKTAMLTGDSHVAAMYTHQQVGNVIEVIHAELLPEDKAKLIMEFKKERPTAMVGDGINDAPALATADIGISMGISGSALATESAHMILMSNDMRNLSKAIKLSKKATRKVIQNIVLSIATKIAILALAIAGHPLVWAAVLADVGTCILVILNSMLLLRESHSHHGAKCCKSTSSTSHVHKHKSSDDHRNKKCCPVSHSSSAETLSSSHCNGKKCHDSDNLLLEKSCETRNCHKRSCKGTNHHDYSEERQKVSDDHRLRKCCPGSHASLAETISSSQCNGKEFHGSGNSHMKKSCEARHCHERSCEETNRDHLESRTKHDTDHQHSKKCNHHSESSFRDENRVRNSETHCCSKKNGDPADYAIIDVTHVNGNHVESETVDRMKQETGGCCESHVTKCCNSNHGNHGDGFKALSEVVIEY